ncbi:hypothetical protein [Phascolarctobacterium succinatutens]|uniref:hypothetical protein n=1 Tax=Phascolarctobacterium succinatutens TaxID=626940 RepID=UPI003077C444
MVFDKLQSINRKTSAVCVAALLIGFIAGAGYAWSSNKTSPHYNTAKLTSELHYAKVETGRLQCVVLQDKAAMYSDPSGLHGKVVDYLSAGVKLDYIDTVSSQDKDERYAVTEQQMQFRKFFGRRHIIPAGTQVLVLQPDRGNGETKGRVLVDDKEYDLDFSTNLLRFPYVGQWKKVELNGKPGFVKYNALSDAKLM